MISLSAVETVENKQRRRCIEEATKLLEQVKSGEIYAFIAVCDLGGSRDWSIITSGHHSGSLMIGKTYMALNSMAHQMETSGDDT